MVYRCWFCGKRIHPGKTTNRHHTIAKRYFRGNPNQGNLVVLSHRTCHCAWHRDVDRGDLTYPFYIVLMQVTRFGLLAYQEESDDTGSESLGLGELSVVPPTRRRARSDRRRVA